MPGFFDALKDFKPKEKKPHVVTIEGHSIVVSLERKLEIMQAGEDAYTWEKGEVVRKKRIPVEQRQPILQKADNGVNFYKQNPFWVNSVDKDGYVWWIE